MSEPYTHAGVSFERGRRSTRAALKHVSGGGGFSGSYPAELLKTYRQPLLLSTTDGLGTKTKLAHTTADLERLGRDLVHHCVNDLLVHGGRPLFFSDYLGTDRLDAERDGALIRGCAEALAEVGASLSGGELAEMPDIYQANSWELVGTLVGVVEASEQLSGARIRAGDVVLGLRSTGLHTNGYTLARRLLGPKWRAALLQGHRCYWPEFLALKSHGAALHGLVHVTGGGLIDNPPRVLGPDLTMVLNWQRWHRPPLFYALQESGGLSWTEMARVFNCGIGLLIITDAHAAQAISAEIDAEIVGHIEARGPLAVRFEGSP